MACMRLDNYREGGKEMKHKPLLMLYSLAHFWVDLSCAFLAFRFLAGAPNFLLCLLLYNFCAFALQMPLGLWADGLNRNGVVAASGCVLAAAAFLVPVPLAAAVIAGTGNALFHLGGGIDVLNTSEKKAAALGVFVSPGAVGLYVGTLWGGGTVMSTLLPPLGAPAAGRWHPAAVSENPGKLLLRKCSGGDSPGGRRMAGVGFAVSGGGTALLDGPGAELSLEGSVGSSAGDSSGIGQGGRRISDGCHWSPTGCRVVLGAGGGAVLFLR